MKLAKIFKIPKKQLNFQDSLAEKQVEKLSDRNRNLLCDRKESLCATCAKFKQFGALHVDIHDL